MELFIQIRDGKPFEHPIMGDNFRQVFPHIDTNNLPPEFARFVRVEPPAVFGFNVYEGATYELVDGVYTDVHHVRPMTEEEKTREIASRRNESPPKGWVFSEETYTWVPPELSISLPGSVPDVIE